MPRLILLFFVLRIAISAHGAEPVTFPAEQIEFFESKVRPLLVAHCYDCHSTDAKELKAALYVDSREGILKGGESGPSIVVGNPKESELIAAVRYETVEMPPNKKLSDAQIGTLAKWVEMGAPWPTVTSTSVSLPATSKEIDWKAAKASHWAWKSYSKPNVPAPNNGDVSNPIDCFVDARLKRAKLDRSPPAELHILARRIYVDLIGVVPTPTQASDFVDAASRDRQMAVADLVDALLQSPLYGQRWARHWLDVARYSDGRGGFLDNAALDAAWRYRDWVIDAMNSDMPIDRFLELQIAGDLLGDYNDAVATGFFAVGPTYRSDGGDPDSVAQAKGETLDDRMDTLTRGLLGITGSCARCHDHKFDPIPQIDYYSLAGVFNNSNVHNVPLAEDEVVQRYTKHRKEVDALNKKVRDFRRKLKKEKRDANDEEQTQLDRWENVLQELKADAPPSFDTAHALHDTGDSDMHVAIRGNLRRNGKLAPRRFFRILAGENPEVYSTGSGRRELATEIVAPSNPLTARVFVNRIWLHHFGQGIVRTPSNFGTLGEKPTHPKLLDWLATEFVENGWSLKQLHRQIMLSETYQQSSSFRETPHQLDGGNRWLWRMNPRRMDIEAWRDSILCVTGELEPELGGPPVENIERSRRRTVYAKVSRNGDVFASDAFLRRFDFPLMRATVTKRPNSIVPQQYLFLLNSQFMVDRAGALVNRLHAMASDDQQRIETAYQLLYGRAVEPAELRLGMRFLSIKSQNQTKLPAWEQYAQTLLGANEFMYVR